MASMKKEDTPLMDEFCDHLTKAYGTESHAKDAKAWHGGKQVLVDYEPLKFSSFRVFTTIKGTILTNPVLFVEQFLITAIFFSCSAPVYIYYSNRLGEDRHGPVSIRRWINNQEGKMRAFAMIMTGLAAFLLSFYTAMAVARWWVIRTGGVGGIKAATVELEMFISQLVTREQQVLSAIRRYGRTSLMLIFIWRQDQIKSLKDHLTQPLAAGTEPLLTEAEANELCLARNDLMNLHETIWAWQAGIVTMLYKEKKIKSEQLFSMLLDRVSKGRAAVQLVHTHLAVRIPMQYVHLLGFLVKMHNMTLAVILGFLFGGAVREKETIICVQLFGRTLLLPFLFNAILLINAQLCDPFCGSSTDFPGMGYQSTLEKDAKSMVDAVQSMPDWLSGRIRLPDMA